MAANVWLYMVYKCFAVSLGIVLVHDLTNKKSSQNLYRWSLEALNKDSSPTGVIVSNGYILFFNTKSQTPIHVQFTAYDKSLSFLFVFLDAVTTTESSLLRTQCLCCWLELNLIRFQKTNAMKFSLGRLSCLKTSMQRRSIL